MSRTDHRQELLTRLEAALDIWGPRPERWPEAARAELDAFVQEDETARKLVAEALALDRVLALAPEPAGTGALEARILAAAGDLPEPQRGASVPGYSRRLPQPVPRNGSSTLRRHWPEAALLAASLAAGVLIGISGQALPALQGLQILAGGSEAAVSLDALFEGGSGRDQEAL